MKNKSVHTLMLPLFVCLFACILICGTPRLIATEETQRAPVCALPRIPCAYNAAPSRVEVESRSTGGYEVAAKRPAFSSAYAADYNPAAQPCDADSNGNVLHCGTYMRSVYQSFALGDGFV